jgi:CHAT domain-containing protein/tetratricopeptide (TPR) repeat protein
MKLVTLLTFSVMLIGATIVSTAHAQTWQELLAKADLLTKAAKYDSAIVFAQQALEITEREYGKEDTCVPRVLQKIGGIFFYQGKYPDAEPYWKRALEIREKVLGPEHPDVAKSLNNLAILYSIQGRYAEEELLVKRALQICEKAFGPEHPDVALSVNNLGSLYRHQGCYAKAEPLYTRALQIWEKALGAEHPNVATCLSNLAILYWEQGRYTEEEPLVKRTIQIREKTQGADHPDVAREVNNLANLYKDQGRYADAEPLYLRALKIFEKALGADHPDVARSVNNLASLYRLQGRYTEEEPLVKRALQICEKAFGPEHPDVARYVNNLASLYRHQGRYADAEPLYLRALQILEKALGAEHPDVAHSLSSLANLYQTQGRYADAEPLYLRALQIREKALGAEHPDVADGLNNLANLYQDQGRYTDAEPLYLRALRIQEKVLGPEHPEVATSLSNLADLYGAQGQYAEATELESRAWSIQRGNMWDNGSVLAERNALEYSQFLIKETARYLSILLDAPGGQTADNEKITHVVLSSKGQVTDEILARNRSLVTESDSAAIKLSDTLRFARFALSKLYVDGLGKDRVDVYRGKLEKATKEKERLEVELARSSSRFQREQELWDANALIVTAALPTSAVLVEFMRYDHRTESKNQDVEPRYLALVISGSGARSVFPLGAASDMDTAVYWYRQQFRNVQNLEKATYTTVAGNLYRLAWRPFEALLENASTVFVAPDGNLNLVSFAGLKDDNGKYLIEKYPIQYLSTGRDLLRLKDKTPSGTGLLAMGDPDFDLSYGMSTVAAIGTAILAGLNLRSSCEALNRLNVPRLPNTRKEVESVAASWRMTGATAAAYFGSDATEENFKQNAPGKRIIHLATHGFYISDECQKKLNTLGGFGTQDGGYVGENPLLLSGLLLAGANKHNEGANEAKREDGIVTAEEVAGMNLRGTDLVVLSACETGLGTVRSGEGVYGLRRAFQMAGARTVISALWPIDDKATAEFMGQLFSAQNETMPQTVRRIALSRISALRLQGKSDHPFFWAAFVATGDWKTQ